MKGPWSTGRVRSDTVSVVDELLGKQAAEQPEEQEKEGSQGPPEVTVVMPDPVGDFLGSV